MNLQHNRKKPFFTFKDGNRNQYMNFYHFLGSKFSAPVIFVWCIPDSFIVLPLVTFLFSISPALMSEGSKMHIWLCHFITLKMSSLYFNYLPVITHKPHQVMLEVATVEAGRSNQTEGDLEGATNEHWGPVGWGSGEDRGVSGEVKGRAAEDETVMRHSVRMSAYFSGPIFNPSVFSQMHKVQRNSLARNLGIMKHNYKMYVCVLKDATFPVCVSFRCLIFPLQWQ